MQAVDVYVKYKDTTPCAGATVAAYTLEGVLCGSQVTDGTGAASFLLAEDTTYQLRFFKFATLIKNPQYIEVVTPSPGVTNIFDIEAEAAQTPATNDPRMCMCYGYFRKDDGSPARNMRLQFLATYNPMLVDGNAIMPEGVDVTTDESGFAAVTLVRWGIYDVQMQDLSESTRRITVPNQASCNLPDLLFPTVRRIRLFTMDEHPTEVTTSIDLAVGQARDFTVQVQYSSGLVIDHPDVNDVRWSMTDRNVALLNTKADRITVTGMSAGQTTITTVPWDTSIIVIPNTGIAGMPMTVNVS